MNCNTDNGLQHMKSTDCSRVATDCSKLHHISIYARYTYTPQLLHLCAAVCCSLLQCAALLTYTDE